MINARLVRRMMSCAVAVMLVMGLVTVGIAAAPSADAAGTVLFNQPFHDNTVDGPVGSVSLPTAPVGGGNAACLTAAGNATKNPLASCAAPNDTQGSGKLRFTQAVTGQEGGAFASTSVPTSQGLDVTFNSYQYGGTGADGMAFVLAAVNPANPVIPTALGQSGGALGYSAVSSTTSGLTDGYLGFGFDAYGNFSNKYEGTGCTDPANINQRMPGQVVVRGPGNGTAGYCALQSSAATATSPSLTLRASTRTASLVPVEVVFNPTSSSITTASGLVVPAGDYDVTFTPVGGTAKSLVGALPVVPSGLYPSSWVSSSGIPKQLVFGWVASTGSITDYHEIDNVLVSSVNPVPQLAVSQTSYAAATLAVGSPVTYTVAASSSGAAENQPVTVTETLPAGVVPVGASGTGWTCAAPSGQSISCTSTSAPFTSGTITVNAVVTSSSVTRAQVQSATSAVASSPDASPATSSSAPAGTVPSAPTITAITPANGAAGGGNDVKITGTGLDAATAIEIGTAAQFNEGTPTTVVLCASSAPGCFTVVSSTSLDISSMPGHAAGAVTVKVVTLGISASTSYTYNTGPALLFGAPPSGEVNVAYSDQLTVTGGTSPFTWSVSSGSLPPGVTLNASTGLLSGTPTTAGTYSFTVKVTDNSGLSDTAAATVTIIPGPSMSFAAPPGGWTHTVYNYTLTETGGTSPFTWSVSSGSLPAGISLSPAGVLSGTPTATGTSSFTVKVTDANGQSATQATSISVAAGVSTTFAAPPTAVVNTAYSYTLTATGGTTPYTWSMNAGTLPAGLTLSSAGVISGTPTTAGSSTFTVNVIDANNGVATASITLVVTSSVTFTFSTPPSGTLGTPYSFTLSAAGGTTPYTWSISSGSLPAGLTLNTSTGVVSGTPTLAGTSSFTAKVTDAQGKTATFATSITILNSMLTVAVNASPATVAPGGTVTYTITATNAGQTTLTGATFTDPLSDVLDDASYNGDASATAGTVSFASPNLTWTGNLAVGASATITFSVTVNSPDTGNKTLASTVTSTTSTSDCASGSTDARCSSTVKVSILTIAMTASPANATPGAAVSYTITVTNAGTAAYTGATFTDALSGVLDDASYNSNASATAGSVSFASPNLTWTGDLAAGASATVTFSVTVNSPDTGNKSLASTITSATAGSNCASGSTDTRCASTITVLVPGLTTTVSAGTSTATPGQQVTYTVTVTNSGQTAYTGATFTDALSGLLDDSTYDNDASATAGSVSFASSALTWTGNLAVGASATITFSVTVNNPDTGEKLLVDTVTSTTAGSNCPAGSTDARCTSNVTVLVPGLQISASAGSSTTAPGQQVTYTVTVTNSGQIPYTGATFTDPLSGVLDDASYNSDASATAGTVSFASPNLTWTGNLNPGDSATITFSVTVTSPDTGDKTLASTITSTTSGSNCAAGSGGPSCTTNVPVAVLTITNNSDVASATPGSVVRFTAVFTNAGQVPYTGITVASNITNVLDDATPNGDQTATSGSVTLTPTGISWTGSIPVGGSVTITGTVTVNNPDAGNKTMASTVSTTAAGSNCPSGSTDPRCSVSVTVLTPALTIVKTADVSTTSPGGVVHYTVTITDSGPTPYSGATYTDQLDGVLGDASYDNDAAATAGSVSFDSPDMTWTGDLTPGASATVTYSVTVNDPDTGNRILTNTVRSASPGSNCPAGGTDPRCTATVRDLVPGLNIATRADHATATPGTAVQYTITVTNTGQTAYTGASFTEPLAGVLDDASYGNDASATAGSVSFASPNLTWTGNLAPGDSATITFSVTVSNPDTGDKSMTSTATSATVGNNCPASGGTDTACTTTVTVVNATTLTFTATADTAAAAAGGVVHYTITVANSGLTPFNGATFTEPLSDVLDDASYGNDASATAGTVTFTSPSLTWTGNVPASGTVTITYSVTVNSPDAGNHVLASTITSTSAGSDCGAGSGDPRCTATVNVAALSITATADVSSVTPGSDVHYTVTAVNTGQAPYSNASITLNYADTFEDAAYNGDLAATSGTVTDNSATQTATWTGNLAPGATVTITYSVRVLPPDNDTGDSILTLTVDSAALGNNCPAGGTDPACTAAVPILVPALTITQTANTTAAAPGATVTYTVTVADTGQTPYTGAVVTDSLDGVLGDAAYNNDAAASAGTVGYASPDLTWTGNLAVGGTVTITYSVTVKNPDTGGKLMVNFVTSTDSGSSCPFDSPNPGCTTSIPVLTPALTIVTTASPASAAPGQQVTYTIRVTDTGQTPYAGAVVTDDLTGLLDDAAYDADAAATRGTVSYASPDLTWTGNLNPGQAATITYTVTVDKPETGDDILTSTVTSAAPGSNCGTGSTDPRCASTVTVSELVIDSTADVSSTTPGGVVHYTTTLTNTGQTPYVGISMNIDASGLIDDAAADGDETATSGTFVIGTTGAVWTGDIPVGATVTLAGSVTVNNPDTGDHVLTDINTIDAPGSNCPAGSTDPPCSTTIDVLTPALSIVTTASTTAAVPGQQVTFTVTVTDTGQTPYTGAAVTDTLSGLLGDAAYDGDAAATTGSVSYAAPVLTWTGDLAPGGSAVITYTVTVKNPDTGGKLMVNTVASTDTGSTCPPGNTSAGCSLSIPVLTPALTIATTASPASAAPGQQVTYTITVTDTGQTPYTGATVADDLTGLLDDAAYDADAAATRGTVSYASPDLTWTGNLNPGQAATITYTVTVNSPDTGNKILTNTVTSAASGSNCGTGSTDPRCASTVTVATLSITNTANVSTTTPGGRIDYTITITNTGQTRYENATVTDDLTSVTDDSVAFGNDGAATTGSISYVSPNLTWTGNLAPGQSAMVTYSVIVNNPDNGDKTITSTAISDEAGSTCPSSGPAPACTSTVTVLIPVLTITKTASTATTTPGSTVGYTVTVTDTGPTPYAGATVTDNLNGVLPDAAYGNDAAATTGTVSFASPDLTWTGDLNPGDSATITYTVTVDNPDTGDKTLVNSVSSDAMGSTCPPGSGDPACTATVTDLIPALTIVKTASTASTTPGSTVGFTVTVTDTGQTPYTGATVTDDLGGVLADAAYGGDAAASAGTVSYASPDLTWTGDLNPGDHATITYSVTVDNPDTGHGALANAVTSAVPGSTCPAAGPPGPDCTVTVAVVAGPLTITVPATASLGSAAPGGTLRSDLGTVQVTDNRGFGASWTATVSSTGFATGTGTPAETIPAADAEYDITALTEATGPATFTPVPVTQLSASPQAVVSATNVAGNTAVSWDPAIQVAIPATAISGGYTATITHSVS